MPNTRLPPPKPLDRSHAADCVKDALTKNSGANKRILVLAAHLHDALSELHAYEDRARWLRAKNIQRDKETVLLRHEVRDLRFARDRNLIAFNQALELVDRLMAYHIDPESITDEVRTMLARLRAGT